MATDELFTAAQLFDRLWLESAALRRELGAIDRIVTMNGLMTGQAPDAAARAERDIDQAMIVLGELEVEARGIGWALVGSADAYGFIERFIGEMGLAIAGKGSAFLGAAAAVAALTSPLTVIGAYLTIRGLVDAHLFDSGAIAPDTGSHQYNELLTNPLVVNAVRMAAMSLDDAMVSAAGVPYPVAQLLGDNGLGITGLAFASAALMGAGASVGLFTETPVRLVGQHPVAVSAPPAGFSERLSRIPSGADGSQVVVEKYTMAQGPDRYAVYVSGTATFSPQAGTEPFDMTSNMANTAGPGGGSYESVVQAMRAAGADESSPVQLVGYSQGGATVARVAESGGFNVVAVTSFGGPTGQIPIPENLPTVLVEHTDDIVPALGGRQANHQALIVERNVFAGREIPSEFAVPAHHLQYYQDTARLMDAATSDQITTAAAGLDEFGTGATSVTSTAYIFERVGAQPADGARSGAR